MEKFKFQILAACICTIGFFMILGWAGDIDYCDQVILGMSQEQYDYVKDTLTKEKGSKPSEREIAHWWADNHHTVE